MTSSKSKIQRLVFHGPYRKPCLELEELPSLPRISNGEILGKFLMSSICGSDLHTVKGRRKEPAPSVLGHEGILEVIDHQRPDCDVNIGDRITFSVCDSCYKCSRCQDGLHQKCLSLFKYGHANLSDGTGLNGCYATHIVLRQGTHITKVPFNIPNKIAAPINCALATMVNVTDSLQELIQCGIKGSTSCQKRTVLIQGAGLLGIYGCALLLEAGFKVFCSDINPKRLNMVSRFGAVPLSPGSSKCLTHLEDESIDGVIENAGVSSVVSEGIKLLRPGGVYVFAGMVHPHTHLNITGEQIIRKCLTIKGVHNYSPKHLDKAVEFLASTVNKYPYGELMSEKIFSLHEFEEAMKVAEKQTYFRVCIGQS